MASQKKDDSKGGSHAARGDDRPLSGGGFAGTRQVGTTTLALNVAATRPSLYLDLELPGDQARLTDPKLYLADHEDKLVILDEVHRRPKLFQPLRGLIDRGRREGRGTGRFLLSRYVIETLLGVAPPGTEASFYRTLAGAEMDVVLVLPGGRVWTIEVKRSVAPKLERGFHHALTDLTPDKSFVVYNGQERFPLNNHTEAISLVDLARALMAVSG